MTGQAIDMVKPQALPRSDDGKMQKVIVAFDVDGTLIRAAAADRVPGVPDTMDEPIERQIAMLKALSSFKNVRIVVWSGGGINYASFWGRRLGLEPYVWRFASKLEHPQIKAMCDYLIVIDDIQSTRLGDVNLIVREK